MNAIAGGRLGVVVSQFPELHETFIVRELHALREAGVSLRIYSLKWCRDRVVHPEALDLIPVTTYLAWNQVSVWLGAWAELMQHPFRGLATLGWVLRRHARPVSTLAKALVVWVQGLALARAMRRDGVGHVHAHWATMPTTAAVIASGWLRLHFSFTAHAWDLFVLNPSLREKVRLAAKVITCTEYNRHVLVRLCPDEAGKIILNYHGVDVERFRGSPSSGVAGSGGGAGTDRPGPLFLSVGRLVETKGFGTLIEAYRLLRDRGAGFRAVIVGEGRLRRRLARQIQSSRLAGVVELRLSVGQDELRRLYGRAFALVQPSVIAANRDRDGIPNVLLEGMAMRLPVVSTAISGIPEAVEDGRTGLLVPPGDPQRLAEALAQLLEQPSFARMLGDHGWARVRAQFDAKGHMDRLVRHMTELLDVRAREPCRPVKVLYVIWSLEVGGAEQVVRLLASRLDRGRFAPTVVCLNGEGRMAGELRRQGVQVIALHKRPGMDLGVLWKLFRIMRRLRPDIVHTHLWGGNTWGRAAAALARVRTVIAQEHGLERWRTRGHELVDRWLAGGTDRFIFVSHEVARTYQRRTDVPAARCTVIPNGVELARFVVDGPERRQARAAFLAVPDTGPLVVSVGRLVPEKGYPVLLDAVARVRRELPGIRLVIVGDGPERAMLEQQAADAGLDGAVQFLGTRGDVPQLLAAADLVVQASLKEGLPLALLEAMAAGRPIVATGVGGVPEILTDGETGRLVPPQDAAALARAIVEAWRAPEQRQAWAAAARAMAEARFGVERMVERTQAVYEECLAS